MGPFLAAMHARARTQMAALKKEEHKGRGVDLNAPMDEADHQNFHLVVAELKKLRLVAVERDALLAEMNEQVCCSTLSRLHLPALSRLHLPAQRHSLKLGAGFRG